MQGHLHPLTRLEHQIVAYFEQFGFQVVEGPEIETEEYNFDLLNIPKDHPARDEHDTFYLTDGRLLRTHTSPMQLRIMKEKKPPIRILVPGRVFRNESTDATHNHTFYQIEGLVIDRETNFTHLIGMLEGMLTFLFDQKLEFRYRPSYFPFVEPGMELDLSLKPGQWLEVLGAGMVHPNVLKNMGLDSNEWQGFAFGAGLERLLYLISGVDDVRLSFNNEYRFLGQF